jgi:serine protease Do
MTVGRPLLLLLLVPGAAGCQQREAADLRPPAAAAQAAPLADSINASRRTAIVDAVGKVAPAVVSIRAVSRRQVAEGPGFFDFFFIPREREQRAQSFGTGFAIRRDGHIITNQHVVNGADSVTVSLADGQEHDATIVGEDPTTDIAVLRIGRRDMPVPTMGQTRDLMVGEWTVALGNPYTYMLGNSEPTVTAGVVSATGRNILPNRYQAGLYLDMIQTDAPINPGNSGGPLANALGEVIGVNSSIFTQTGESVGLGFAIPIERALRVADEIIRQGAVRRAWTGLEVAGQESMREWKRSGGVAVTRVAPDGPAARAGLREGAVVVEANGRPVRNFLDWEAVKLDLHVGDAVELTVRDGDRTLNRRIVTGDLPTVTAAKVNVLRGMELVTVTPSVQAERGLRSDQGALVFRLTDEVRSATGLREGDVIIGFNRTRITSANQLAGALDRVGARQTFRLYFEREGQLSFTDLAFR